MKRLSDEYHKFYEENRLWENNSWLGEPCWKLPMDAFVIQELIYKLEPDFIIETGTGKGGSALFYASIMELMGHGNVITCDIEKRHNLEDHYMRNVTQRISFIEGSSTDLFTIEQIQHLVGGTKENIVLLDSWHSSAHVCQELGIYEAFVGEGFYLIVEDTHAGKPGHPIEWDHNDGGAYAAVQFFLDVNKDFQVDWGCEKHGMTFNTSGYLRRVKW